MDGKKRTLTNRNETNGDKITVIDQLKDILKRFRDQRNWAQFHDPKNLAEAVSIEAAELLELFLWKTSAEIEQRIRSDAAFMTDVENELADVICFCLNLANALDIDVSTIVRRKIRENKSKYPVRLARNRSEKYTKLRKSRK